MDIMEYLKKAIIPTAWFLFLIYIGKYICIVDGQVEWFRVMLLFGIPYGIPYMLFYAPGKWGISGGIGMLALEVIIGASFGIVIAAVAMIRAGYYLIVMPISRILYGRK